MLTEWLAQYHIQTPEDEFNARREVFQAITLAGLARGKFFERASFYGGSALRMFYKLDRFSEDLDFSLNKGDDSFSIKSYFGYIEEEFQILDLPIKVEYKEKRLTSNIESAFLKSDTALADLRIQDVSKSGKTSLKIKIEVDTVPPLKFEYEPKLLLLPYSFYVNVMKAEYLFAGKLHALLFRGWKTRVKGRDWYDFEWYIKHKIPLNLMHFIERATQSGHLSGVEASTEVVEELLNTKIQELNIEEAKNDAKRFIANPQRLDIWSKEYFLDLASHLIYAK